ncbi:hypothetical protein PR048_005600 [Dryococelus australis]|uniref:Uncharacterized protein n=1 Tax=Dryococelus australis TaxID=614101 RepID=A0ABQ9I9P9_9NEOP|nr:hypothetical protein PR048_005600 [Dryococelus australis]
MAAIGRVGEFCPHEEEVASYVIHLKHYFKANQIKDENKVSVLFNVIGPNCSDLVSPEVKVLVEHYTLQKIVMAECYVFYSRVQEFTEKIAECVVATKHLETLCKFATFLSEMLHFRCI